jgi:hypothetical protein
MITGNVYHRCVARLRRALVIAAITFACSPAHAGPPAPPAAPAAPAPPPAPAAPAPPPAPVGAVAPIDRVIAVVDGGPIWWSAYTEALATEPPPESEVARKQLETAVLDRLIDETLVLQRARIMRIEVADDAVDAGLQEILEQNHLDEAGLEAALAQMGMTMPRYREEIRKQIMELRAFIQAVPTEHDTPPEKREALHEHWLAELRRNARIERR